MGRYLLLISALLIATAAGAGAFEAGDLARLRAESGCPSCDLSAAPLAKAALGRAELSGADLSDAFLPRTDGLSQARSTRPAATRQPGCRRA